MRIAVILSAGGSHKNVSDAHAGQIVDRALSRAGHTVTTALVPAARAERAVLAALESEAHAIVVGGADELVWRATNLIADTPKALGIVPLGRLNPLAHVLGVPADLEQAALALGRGVITSIDVGEVNGRVFAVQAALGLYPWLVRHRELLHRGVAGSSSSVREALWYAVAQQPLISAYVEYNGLLRAVRTPWLAIANGSLLDGAGRGSSGRGQDASRLQLYIGKRRSMAGWLRRFAEVAAAGRLSPDSLLGGRSDNAGLEPIETHALIVRPRRRRLLLALDGTVELVDAPLRYHVRRDALRVLRPAL